MAGDFGYCFLLHIVYSQASVEFGFPIITEVVLIQKVSFIDVFYLIGGKVGCWAISCNTQGLFLNFCLKVNPGSVWETKYSAILN